MANPIWKDYFVSLGNVSNVPYRIKLHDGGTLIYSGNAYRRPGDTSIRARINDICADFFTSALPAMSQTDFSLLGFPISFDIETWDEVNEVWENVETVAFDNDWSYDYGHDPERDGVSAPINGRLDSRMPLLYSVYDATEVEADVIFQDGTSFHLTIPIATTADFDDSFDDSFARETRGAATGTAVLIPSEWDGCVRIDIGGHSFDVVTECAKYALYYINAYGGWDELLIEGNHKESDSMTRHEREVEYDNVDIRARGRDNWLNEIDKTWQLYTSYLTDEQSRRMSHLFGSTCVYLYDIEQGAFIPVTVTDKAHEYKTFKNQGRQLVSYVLNVRLAQNRIRR